MTLCCFCLVFIKSCPNYKLSKFLMIRLVHCLCTNFNYNLFAPAVLFPTFFLHCWIIRLSLFKGCCFAASGRKQKSVKAARVNLTMQSYILKQWAEWLKERLAAYQRLWTGATIHISDWMYQSTLQPNCCKLLLGWNPTAFWKKWSVVNVARTKLFAMCVTEL